jgi:hypothetical protein
MSEGEAERCGLCLLQAHLCCAITEDACTAGYLIQPGVRVLYNEIPTKKC